MLICKKNEPYISSKNAGGPKLSWTVPKSKIGSQQPKSCESTKQIDLKHHKTPLHLKFRHCFGCIPGLQTKQFKQKSP